MAMEHFDLFNYEIDQLAKQAQKWCRDIVVTVAKGSGPPKRGPNGTGVLLEVGGVPLVVTAAHVIEETDGNIQLVPAEGQSPIGPPFEQIHVDKELDLAIVQLTSDQASSIKSFAGKDNILVDWDTSEELPLLVSGYPLDRHFPDRPDRLVSQLTHVMATSIPPSHWPEVPMSPEPKEGRDILIEHTEETYAQLVAPGEQYSEASGQLIRTPHPRGMSGGAVWIPSYLSKKDSGIRVPCLQLVGILIGFRKSERILRAVRIGHVLDLIEKHYPHLTPELDEIRARKL